MEVFKEVCSSVVPDLIRLTWKQRLCLILFALIVTTFNVIDFNSATHQKLALKWDEDKADGVQFWRRILMCLSAIASFSGVTSVSLCSLGKLSYFFWSPINCITYGLYAFAYGYCGDAQLYVLFYLPMSLIGAFEWVREMENPDGLNSKAVKVRSLTFIQTLLSLGAIITITVVFYYEIPAFSKAVAGFYAFEGKWLPRLLDASCNGLSIVAQTLSLYRYWQAWLLWIAVNAVQIAMFSGTGGFGVDFNILCMVSLFMCNALYGLWTWYRRVFHVSMWDTFVVWVAADSSSGEVKSGSSRIRAAGSVDVKGSYSYSIVQGHEDGVEGRSSDSSVTVRSPLIDEVSVE